MLDAKKWIGTIRRVEPPELWGEIVNRPDAGGLRGNRSSRRPMLTALVLIAALAVVGSVLYGLRGLGRGPGPLPGTGSSDPASVLHAAAAATLGAQSFHWDITYQTPGVPLGRGTADYQAPDREDFKGIGGSSPLEDITIGDTLYVTVPSLPQPRPGYFYMLKPPKGAEPQILGYLKIVADRAEQVRFDGHAYHFTFQLPQGAQGVGQATISNGLLDVLTLHLPAGPNESDVVITLSFSAFNSGITVEPPPADHILVQPTAPPCPPSGIPPASGVCVPTSPSP